MIRFKTYSVIRPVSREVIEDAFTGLNGRDIIFVAPEFAKAQIEREVLAFKETRYQSVFIARIRRRNKLQEACRQYLR